MKIKFSYKKKEVGIYILYIVFDIIIRVDWDVWFFNLLMYYVIRNCGIFVYRCYLVIDCFIDEFYK